MRTDLVKVDFHLKVVNDVLQLFFFLAFAEINGIGQINLTGCGTLREGDDDRRAKCTFNSFFLLLKFLALFLLLQRLGSHPIKLPNLSQINNLNTFIRIRISIFLVFAFHFSRSEHVLAT